MARWCWLAGVFVLSLGMWAGGAARGAEDLPIGAEWGSDEPPESIARLILVRETRAAEPAPVTSVERAVNQRRELIAAMHQLQQEYCKAGDLDAALLVRRQLKVLERQAAVSFPALPASSGPATSPPVIPNPGPGPATELPKGFGREIGRTWFLPVTGRTDGPIWGSGLYTSDSDIGTAAVHAGLLKAGESGVARVSVLPGEARYRGSSAHGVTTNSWESYPSSYRIDGVGQTVTTAYHLRGQSVEPITVYVVGRTGGTVWGTDDYTDDSDIATAAVHAGLVKVGEEALVRLTPGVGLMSYVGSTRNGVASLNYGNWGGTYRLGRVTPSLPAERLTGVTNLEAMRSKVGAVYIVELTGRLDGVVYGTDFYTTDSNLAAAAVHAGLLELGQTAILAVEITGERTGFASSARHGVTSHSWETWGGFRFVAVPATDGKKSVDIQDSNVPSARTGLWGEGPSGVHFY